MLTAFGLSLTGGPSPVITSQPPKRCVRPAPLQRAAFAPSLIIMALVVMVHLVLAPTPARADQFIGLGDGVVLAYETGSLDPVTLEGSADGVRLMAGDEAVATIDRLTLATQGALSDSDFTIDDLEARGIVTGDGHISITEVTAHDVPIGTLRTFAEKMDALGGKEPDPAFVLGFLNQITLGAVTVRGFSAKEDDAEVKIARASLRTVGGGKVGVVEIENGSLTDKNEPVYISLGSARMTNLSVDPRVLAGLDLSGFSIVGDDVNLVVGKALAVPENGTLSDGTPYPARSSLTVTDVVLQPGLNPDKDITRFFKDLGQGSVRMQLDAVTTVEPEGNQLDVRSELNLNAQTGDAVALSSRWQVPIVSWQLFSEIVMADPATIDPESLMQMVVNIAFVNASLDITAADLGDTIIATAARDEGIDAAAMREQISDDVEGALLSLPLPGGGASFRDAILGFIAQSGTLSLGLSPAYPLPISTLMVAPKQPQVVLDKLNITLTHRAR